MSNKFLSLFLLSNVLIILDQFSKRWVQGYIPENHSLPIIEGFFSFTHIRNPGVAFGIFASNTSNAKIPLFIIFSIIAILAILVFYFQTPRDHKVTLTGLILLFSGAIGNLIDRIMYHEVVDFLDFYIEGMHFPAFNIADSCITIGVGLMFIDLFKKDQAAKKLQAKAKSQPE
ncbi:MAG: signal peptidase II [Candidatus Nitronauta litoralis]|uniref:Lipoprotein signal peptidase n=1 Tax=Candidatus Nitronauta litoralis TaxID=2705533 RepID=A0A7T0G1T8_9BACT|nr:MAG: signal peptidase II [Candidatus Nitronauta litoralis]